MSGNKQLIVQIQLFQTKMFCGPLQNTSVAHRWAMAHRLKTTALEQILLVEITLKIEESTTVLSGFTQYKMPD